MKASDYQMMEEPQLLKYDDTSGVVAWVQI